METITRRSFMVGAAATALASARISRSAQRSRSRPNVIIVLTDDQGYGDLSFQGNRKLSTPNIDSVGKQGVAFTRFYVCPVCSPTRASLMTGRYNYRTGVLDTWMGRSMMYSEEITMAELLGAAGYKTGIFGKWHLGDDYPMRSIDQGFQESVVIRGGGLEQPANVPNDGYFDPVLQHDGKPEKYSGYCTDIFFNAAIKFIEESRDQPFFAYIPTNAPHTPLEIADAYVAPFRAMGLDETTAKVYGMIVNLDQNMGRLLAKLKALELEQDTILIFLSDNGPQQPRYNAGLRGLKTSVYEGGLRVPCFVKWPRALVGGRQIDRMAAHIDILPTILEACGADKPPKLQLDGKSLMPLLRRSPINWPDRTLYFQWHRGDEPQIFRNCAAVTQKYKLIDGKELYDLSVDPGEQKDIAGAHYDIVARMRNDYEEWFHDVSSTRGFAPPRIYLGTEFENPVMLTRQDWRGPLAGWEPDSLGYWEVEVTDSGNYEVTLDTYPAPDAGEAHFKLNGTIAQQPVEKGGTECKFANLALRAGEGRLEAFLQYGDKRVGVCYVYVKRL